MRFALLFLIACTPGLHPSTPIASSPTPEPAIPAILAAFDRYDVVAVEAGHGGKEVDDFLLTLIRDPGFAAEVNDIAVECGNSRDQALLDRYIAGEDVAFAEVRKVWRDTTQEMCGVSGFYEQLFPLVRAINQTLPPARRLRVLACDPPIDWDQVKTSDDAWKFLDRDPGIAHVMEQEVLSKHRKALMLFGTFHLMHGTAGDGAPPSAVSIYEKDYPGRTFVIGDLGLYDAGASWPDRSLVLTRGTALGALSLKDFFPPPITVRDCHVTMDFPPNLQQPVAALVDAFLALGPPDLMLMEPIPADVALDTDYLTELSRRESLLGPPGAPVESAEQLRADILAEAATPIRALPPRPDAHAIEQDCRDREKGGAR